MIIKLKEYLDKWNYDTNYVPIDYPFEVNEQVVDILSNGINDQAINRIQVEWITIDWVESMDLDDAIWAEKTKNWYCVWIHISDVSEYINIYSALDIEAFRRTTSIYRKENIINMLPNDLSNDLVSLNQNWVKKVVTLQIDLSEEAEIKNYKFYEANFINLKRYDYKSFSEDYQNKDNEFYNKLNLLKEISNKLHINRLKSWWTVWYQDEDRRMFLWNKNLRYSSSCWEKVSHDIIESFMVLANMLTWRYFIENNCIAIYKQHLWIDERSFYIPESWEHKWLWIRNYTHFSSPIRRYIDIINHRLIKTILRWEKSPYSKIDLEMISENSNNIALKIDVLWAQIDFEYKWKCYLQKTKTRLWREPEVYDMKDFIRNRVYSGKKLPKCMKETIIEKIETSPIWNWWWMIWVILFWKDNDLKKYLKEKLLNDKPIRPWKLLHIIARTQIIKWEKTIFEIKEIEDCNSYRIELFLHDNLITKYKSNSWKLWSINYIKWKVRLKIIEKIFDYFIDL